MKKTISLTLAVLMIASMMVCIPLTATAGDYGDYGVVSDGYAPVGTAITSAADFAAMTADGTYYLANSIEISATYANAFKGTFDGNGKTVTTTAPLFTTLDGATVKNLTIGTADPAAVITCSGILANLGKGSITINNILNTVNVSNSAAVASAGGLICTLEGSSTFNGCYNAGDVTGVEYAGGIFGYVNTQNAANIAIDNCINDGVVDGRVAGGITAWIATTGTASFKNITNNGNVTSGDVGAQATGVSSDTGGIIAIIRAQGTETVFENCVNNGDISARTYERTGGLVGQGNNVATIGTGSPITFINCSNTGDVTAGPHNNNVESRGYAAGIISNMGSYPVNLKGCSNSGNMLGSRQIGGLVAYIGAISTSDECIIEDCYNSGTITVTGTNSTAYAGGIVGDTRITSKIRNCINIADITGYYGGGIAGDAYKSIEIVDCYNSGDITGRTYVGGIIGAVQETVSSSVIKSCGNEGNVKSITGARAAGIIAYAAGGATKGIVLNGCYNTGNIDSVKDGVSGTGTAAFALMGYINNSSLISIYNCYNTGTLAAVNKYFLYENVHDTLTSTKFANNYTTYTNCYLMKEAKANVAFASAGTFAAATTAEEVANGKLTYKLNNLAQAETVANFMQVTGTDAHPVLKNNSKICGIDSKVGASIRLTSSEETSGIRFGTTISKAAYDKLIETYGAENVKLNTLISPTQYVTRAGAFTKEALDAYAESVNLGNKAYIDNLEATEFFSVDGDEATFVGSIVYLYESNFDLDYSGIGFIEITDGDNSFTIYADYSDAAQSRAIEDVAIAALASDTVYSADELAILNAYAGN